MSAPDNPYAFPEVPSDSNAYEGRHGMTLRDWFAGQALAGMASIALDDGDMVMGWGDMSKAAYLAADTMLAARTVGVPAEIVEPAPPWTVRGPDPACANAGPDHGPTECPGCWVPF